MTETTVGAPALVTELDEERRRYETWLEQLEARRGATPEHVYARVRDDYRARLRGVVERLAEHAEALRAGVAELQQRADTLRAEEQRVQDDRAEAELRAMVGEYSAERWEQIQRESDAALAALADQRAAAEAELERLRQLLALATSGTASAAAEPALAQPALAEPAVEATPFVDDTAPAPVLEPGPALRRDTPPTTRSLADMTVEPVEGGGGAPGRATPGRAPAVGDTLDGWSRELDDVAPVVDTRRNSGAVDGGGTAIKTLRCQECGTMNYPTEWYCERCGGELATL